jgi:hypothetical protein
MKVSLLILLGLTMVQSFSTFIPKRPQNTAYQKDCGMHDGMLRHHGSEWNHFTDTEDQRCKCDNGKIECHEHNVYLDAGKEFEMNKQ